ncbi:MAG: hypothetical protein WBN22_01905, partial [Verrucomicrobiia bacterium]
VKVDIHADGSVTGTVGDAKLTEGRFESNRGWLGRKLNLYSDYNTRVFDSHVGHGCDHFSYVGRRFRWEIEARKHKNQMVCFC